MIRDRAACRPYRAPTRRQRGRLALIITLLMGINVAVVLYHGDPRQKWKANSAPPRPTDRGDLVPRTAEAAAGGSGKSGVELQQTDLVTGPVSPGGVVNAHVKPAATAAQQAGEREAKPPLERAGQGREQGSDSASGRILGESSGRRRRVHLVLGPGESATGALMAAGVRPGDVALASRAFVDRLDFRRLRPGDGLVAHLDEDGLLHELEVQPRGAPARSVRRGTAGWPASRPRAQLQTRAVEVMGQVATPMTLLAAVTAAGESPALAVALADIYASLRRTAESWPLQAGDSFRLRVDIHFRGESRVGYGPIHAAELVAQGVLRRAFRFTDAAGEHAYYDAEGRPWGHTFLALPLSAAAISSRYGHRRHPVSGISHHHNGIDFAAPAGTTVWAVGDGNVVHAAWQGGFGRLVEVQHAHGWLSQYAHLQEFAVRPGQRVARGQIVGRVGQSGRATGPHLHFGLKHYGVFVDAARPPDAGFALGGDSLGRFRRAQEGKLLALSP